LDYTVDTKGETGMDTTTISNPVETLEAKLARLEAENSALKESKKRAITLKVSEKGGVSLYGLGRFPVTLYKEQWEVVFGKIDDIKAFIKANESRLKVKGE